MNNPLRYTDPSGWLQAALDLYWNLDKGITDYTSFSGRRASDYGGGTGWGGNGGVVPDGAFQNWASWAVNRHSTDDVIGSLWNATASDNRFQTYSKINGDWYNTSTSSFPQIDAWLEKNAIAAARNIGYGKSFVDPGGDDDYVFIPNIWFISLKMANSKFQPYSTYGNKLISIGILNNKLKQTPYNLFLTNDAKLGFDTKIDMKFAQADGFIAYDFYNQKSSYGGSFGFKSLAPKSNADSDIWLPIGIVNINLTQSSFFIADLCNYYKLFLDAHFYNFTHPQTRFGF